MEICNSIVVMFILCVHCTESVCTYLFFLDRNLSMMSHIEHTGCICFVFSSTSNLVVFTYTLSVFIHFNEPLVHQYIVICGCCQISFSIVLIITSIPFVTSPTVHLLHIPPCTTGL